ncbi:hypothetical protein CICLE_v10033781mg [Citrus x clementina]|uniref:Uncharacterized protein n=1 Tax=Citrus clementina TaxID=85681 RepID=V4TD33_CITCL|nr:hypothetical protein CICLE_v10033781mg [Citrus x clementina]
MDLWAVAAATGAGYVAKSWRNLTSKETESSSESLSLYSIDEQPEPRNLLQRKQDQTNPFWRLAGKHDRDGFLLHEEDFSGVTISNNSQRQGENNENLNLLSVTSFSQVLADNENFRVIGNGMQGKINLSDASGHIRSSYHGNENSFYNTYDLYDRMISSSFNVSEALIAALLPGFHNAKFSFFLGISVGIMSTIITNRSKVENMNALITETENLVQDLQEELEMNDLMNIKEIADEDLEVLGTKKHQSLSGTPYALYTEQELHVHNKPVGEEPDDQKEEKSEAILNSTIIFFLFPAGSCVVTDVVHGDLKLDKANDEAGSLSYPDNDVTETSTDHPDETKYAGSPQELSLRLHKVIQSRLEKRIMELETALENSQRRLHSLEMESIVSWRDYHGKVESTSQESETFIDEYYNDNDSWL